MADALAGTGVKVAHPIKNADLRVRGLVDSTTPAEVATAVARVGGCDQGDVRTSEIRSPPSGLGTLWVQCPAAAARKVAVAGKITVGWTLATVEALSARPLQCYRCLGLGHTRQRCTAAEDRSDCCFGRYLEQEYNNRRAFECLNRNNNLTTLDYTWSSLVQPH
nr:uncharacterized protein LOC117229950 [Megalopta genalis]